MALVFADLVQETTSTTGTGTLALTGTLTGYQTFAAIGNANTTYYRIKSNGDSEVGIGTYTASGTTLSRDTVLYSTAGGTTKINVGVGATVICTYPAEKTVILDASGNATGLGTPAAFTATNVTGLPYTGLTGTVPTWNQNTSGNAATVTDGVYTTGAYSNPTWLTSVALSTGTITTAPTASTDIVNKSYADSIASGVNFHAACNYATTVALAANTYNNGTLGVGATLTGNANGAVSIDGTAPSATQRVLIKDEVTQANNGVYIVTRVGTTLLPYILTRATDYDTSGAGTNEIDQGDMLLVISGPTNANTSWVQQTPLPITIGTTALVFIEFAAAQTYTAGTGLTLTTNQFSITAVGSAGTFGSASLIPIIVTNASGQVTGITTAANPQGTVTSTGFTGGLISVATATTTPALTVAGTSGGIPYFSSGTTWATSAALDASALVIGGGAGVAPSTIATGASVTAALGIAVGTAGSVLVNGGVLGTPSSGVLTNCTGTATGLTAGTATTANAVAALGVTRAMLSSTVVTGAKNWVYLGQCTLAANGFKTTTLSWATQFNQLMVEYYIAGYSGNAIGRILVGNVAPVGTETTCCTRLIENSVPVAGSTTSVSVSGWPTALTPDVGQRYGLMFITNQATKVKRMTGHGNWGGTAPTAVPTTIIHDGLYNNVTNSIQQICMANYLTPIINTISTTITLTAGTFVNVWGRNND